MSSVGDAFAALKNVVLLHERMANVSASTDQLNQDLRTLTAKVQSINERLIRIETLAEVAASRGGLPRIEG